MSDTFLHIPDITTNFYCHYGDLHVDVALNCTYHSKDVLWCYATTLSGAYICLLDLYKVYCKNMYRKT